MTGLGQRMVRCMSAKSMHIRKGLVIASGFSGLPAASARQVLIASSDVLAIGHRSGLPPTVRAGGSNP